MEDDIDIYEDLPTFEIKDEEKYKAEIKELSEKCNNCQQENSELKLKIDELLKNNKVLSNNLSSLLKTAKAEITRKDKMIAELRQQNDNMAFRRKGYAKPKPAKASTKPTQDNKYIPVVTPILYQGTNFEIDDTEQIYEPEKIVKTVFGERLRKKILLEEELERAQKEEAKLAALENKAASVRAEEDSIKENKTESNMVVKGSQEISNSIPEGDVGSGKASAISSSSDSLPSYKENERNLYERQDLNKKPLSKRKNDDVVCPEQNKLRMEGETYRNDDMRSYNGNGKHESRFNLPKNDIGPSRDILKHLHHRRGSNNCEESERKREFHGERSKSNHRSRSKSPPQDRRFVEKRADRHRTDRYRDYMDKYEKRRRSRDDRGNDYGNKFSKDLREKIEHRVELKVGGRSDYDNYKSSKFDINNRRGSRESPPPFAKSRTSSKGRVKDKFDDKIQARLSKSSDRLVGANDSHRTSKKRKVMKTILINRELEKSPRTSAEKEVKNKQITSVTPLLDGLTSLLTSNENEIKRTRRKSKEIAVTERKDRESKSQTTSKTSSEKEAMNKTIATSTLLSEKIMINKQHVSITSFLEDSTSLRESDAIPEDLKNQRKSARRKSKEFTDAEMKNHDSESKFQALLKTRFEKEVTKEELTSTTLLPDNLASLPESNAVSEDLKEHRKGAKRKSKELTVGDQGDQDSEAKSHTPSTTNLDKEFTNKQPVSSELLPNDSHKDVANKEGAAVALSPDGLASLPESNEMPRDLPEQLKSAKGNSMDPTVAEVEKRDSELKCQTRTRTNSEVDAPKKQHVSSVVMMDVSEKEVLSTTPLVESSALLPELNAIPKDLKKEHKSARELTVSEQEDRNSKPKSLALTDTSSETEVTTKQHATSELLANDSEKKMENKQPASTAALPDGLVSLTESDEISEDLLKHCKSAREKPKETTTFAEEKEQNSKPKSHTRSRTSAETDVTNNQLVSFDPLSDNSEKKVVNNQLALAKSLSDGSALLSESDAKLKKQRRGAARRKSKEATVVEEKDRDSEPKFQTRLRTSAEEEVTNKELASSALLELASSTLLPDNSTLLTESGEVCENLRKQRKSASRKSKDSKTTVLNENDHGSEPKSPTPSSTSSEKELKNKQLDSSTLSVDGCKEEITTNQNASTTSLSDSLTSLSESDLVSEDLKKERKDARRKSKDPKRRIAKEKVQNSEQKSQMPLRRSSEKEVNNKEHASCVAVAKVLALKLEAKENPNIQKDLNSESRKSPTATLQNLANQLDSPGKWISSVLDNDTEIPPLPSEILVPNDIGSRSFREEKIENIEKFIQNYQDDEHLYCQIVKGDTAEMDSETISCISNTSILDTLSMDTEVDKSENGILENSLMSEHLLLESLSTPVKKTNPPLPSIPPLDTMKQPPLPPIPHPDEKEQDLSELPPSEEKKENLQPLSTPDENRIALPKQQPKVASPDIKHQALPTFASPDRKQQPSVPSPDTKNQVLPPLPSSETTNQPLPSLPSSDTEEQPPSLSSDAKNQPMQPLLSSDSKREDFLPNPPADTKKQPSSLLATSDKKQQHLPPSPNNKNKAISVLASAVTKEQPLPPLSSSDTKEQPLPSLSSSDTKKQPLPPLPSSDTTEQPLPPLPSSNTKKEPLPPLPSSDTKKEPLPPLPPSDTKEQSLPPLPPSDTKEQPLPPLSCSDSEEQFLPRLPSSDTKEEPLPSLRPSDTKDEPLPSLRPSDTKDEPLPSLRSSDKKEQPLSSLSPPPSVKKSLSPRLPSDTKKQQSSLLYTDEKAPPLPSPSEKKDLPATPEEETNPSSQLTLDEKQDLPLLPITHPENNTKLFSTVELPSEKEKTSLATISVPDNETKLILWSLLASAEKKDHTSQVPVSAEKKDHSSELPASAEKKDHKSQLPASAEKKDHTSQLPASAEKKDHKSQLSASAEKKDHTSQLLASSEKRNPTSELPASTTKVEHSFELLASTDKKDTKSKLPTLREETDPTTELSVSIEKVDSSQSPVLNKKVDSSQSPVLNKKTDSLSQLRSSLKEKGPISQVPTSCEERGSSSQISISSGQKDSSSQIIGSNEKKDSSSQIPISSEKKDISSQLPVPSKKKDSLSQLTASSEKQVSSSKVPTSSEKKDISSQLPVPSKKKDSLSQLTASSEKKDSVSQPPAPTDKNHVISVMQNMSRSNSESEKTRAQKIAIKQIRRHKTSCTPIVSRYSRKRRDLVLTDFQPNRCIIIKPNSACDTQTNVNPKVVIKTSPILTKEAKIILRPIESPNFYESTTKKSNNNGETKIERPEKLFKAANNITVDNVKKIESKVPNGVSELRKTDKMDSPSEVVPSMLPAEENLNSGKALEINEGESQSEIEFKEKAALPKIQNPESSSINEQPICVKPMESRSVLKTIAPPDSGGDVIGALSSRKRCLPKEKENESKQGPRQCKIMVIARRRRPMHLEDCSTATTLVSSGQDTNCDQSSKKNNVINTSLNSEKPELVQPLAEPPSKRRKRRSAEN